MTCKDLKINQRLYHIWRGIKQRCYSTKDYHYKWYGGKGITMCDDWYLSYEDFVDWAIKSGYEDNLSIDRINVNGNYEPENCRWVNAKQQANNRSNNQTITFGGITHTLQEWCELTEYTYRVLYYRKVICGWEDEKILTTPMQKRGGIR